MNPFSLNSCRIHLVPVSIQCAHRRKGAIHQYFTATVQVRLISCEHIVKLSLSLKKNIYLHFIQYWLSHILCTEKLWNTLIDASIRSISVFMCISIMSAVHLFSKFIHNQKPVFISFGRCGALILCNSAGSWPVNFTRYLIRRCTCVQLLRSSL